MQDLIYVAIPIVFFALCVAYVRGFDRLVRRGEETERTADLVSESIGADRETAEAAS